MDKFEIVFIIGWREIKNKNDPVGREGGIKQKRN